MRFGDVQDIRKKERKQDERREFTDRLIKQLERLSFISRDHKLATVNGITFTLGSSF